MASGNWDLIQQLQQEFFNVQQQSCSLRLSERNWIEIVDSVLKTHNMAIVYTKDGKEMVTPEQLLHEIKSYLNMHDGRASFGELQDALCVDYAVIEERCMELVKRCAENASRAKENKDVIVLDDHAPEEWQCWRVLDQIVTNEYCDRLQADIIEELETVGRIGVGSLATHYELPADFIRRLLPKKSTGSRFVSDGDVVYSANFLRRAKARLIGILSATVRPQKVATFAQQIGLPENMLNSVMEEAISTGRLSGSVHQRVFIPNLFNEAQQSCIRSSLAGIYADSSVLKRLGVAGDVSEVVKREWSGDEPIPVGSSGFLRKSALNRLTSAIEETCKEPEKNSELSFAGWMDVNAAMVALGCTDGSVPSDMIEELLTSRGRLMEIIDCTTDECRGKDASGESSGEDDDATVDQELADANDDCSVLAVAPWLLEKCASMLYHKLAAKISEKQKKALMATPVAITPGGDAPNVSVIASPPPSDVLETPGTPSGQSSKRKGKGKSKGSASTPALSQNPSVPRMFQVSRHRLVRMLMKERQNVLSSEFPVSAIKHLVYQHIHSIVSRRLAELAAMTPKSSTVVAASSAKLLQQQHQASSGSGNVAEDLPRLVVSLTSCWRGVSQHLLAGTGNTVDRDRRAMAVHLRENFCAPISDTLRRITAGKDASEGSMELLSESIQQFENAFSNADVDSALDALKSLFCLPFARNALNSHGLSANALSSFISTALSNQSSGPGSANRNKKSGSNQASLPITVDTLRKERLEEELQRLKKAVADSEADDSLLLPNVLLGTASLIFERLTGELMYCPGRLVPTLVNFLTTHKDLETESLGVLSRALTASQKQLRGKNPSATAAGSDQKELIDQLINSITYKKLEGN